MRCVFSSLSGERRERSPTGLRLVTLLLLIPFFHTQHTHNNRYLFGKILIFPFSNNKQFSWNWLFLRERRIWTVDTTEGKKKVREQDAPVGLWRKGRAIDEVGIESQQWWTDSRRMGSRNGTRVACLSTRFKYIYIYICRKKKKMSFSRAKRRKVWCKIQQFVIFEQTVLEKRARRKVSVTPQDSWPIKHRNKFLWRVHEGRRKGKA